MRHGWVFDVLGDLKRYSEQNRLVALAAKVDEAIVIARAEIAAEDGAGIPPSDDRAHKRRN